MESSGTPLSLSSLMCKEGEASFLEYDDEYTEIDSLSNNNPCIIWEVEEEYMEYLFRQETGLGFLSHFLSPDYYSSRFWSRNARLVSIDWIFNTVAKLGFKIHTAYLSVTYFDRFLSKRSIDESKPWAVQLLSVACLSLAAKMEEQNVPPLSEYPMEDYRFESRVIKNMELLILSTLEWKLGSATPFAFLDYFATKFCPGSRPEALITKATKHIMAMVKDVNLMDQRPSVIASAAILAAFDATLTKKTLELRISAVSSLGNIESEHVFSCYNLIQERKRSKIKTPSSSNLLSTHSSSTCVLQESSATSSGTKRKLTFEDSENCPGQKLHRP